MHHSLSNRFIPFSLAPFLHSLLKMKLFPLVAFLGAVTSALGQAVVIGAPTSGTTLSLGQTFTAQLLVFVSARHEAHRASIYSKLLVSAILCSLH